MGPAFTQNKRYGQISARSAKPRDQARQDALARSARDIFLNIDVLCTVSSLWSAGAALKRGRCTWSIKGQNHIGLVNRNGVSIHHVADCALIHP